MIFYFYSDCLQDLFKVFFLGLLSRYLSFFFSRDCFLKCWYRLSVSSTRFISPERAEIGILYCVERNYSSILRTDNRGESIYWFSCTLLRISWPEYRQEYELALRILQLRVFVDFERCSKKAYLRLNDWDYKGKCRFAKLGSCGCQHCADHSEDCHQNEEGSLWGSWCVDPTVRPEIVPSHRAEALLVSI